MRLKVFVAVLSTVAFAAPVERFPSHSSLGRASSSDEFGMNDDIIPYSEHNDEFPGASHKKTDVPPFEDDFGDVDTDSDSFDDDDIPPASTTNVRKIPASSHFSVEDALYDQDGADEDDVLPPINTRRHGRGQKLSKTVPLSDSNENAGSPLDSNAPSNTTQRPTRGKRFRQGVQRFTDNVVGGVGDGLKSALNGVVQLFNVTGMYHDVKEIAHHPVAWIRNVFGEMRQEFHANPVRASSKLATQIGLAGAASASVKSIVPKVKPYAAPYKKLVPAQQLDKFSKMKQHGWKGWYTHLFGKGKHVVTKPAVRTGVVVSGETAHAVETHGHDQNSTPRKSHKGHEPRPQSHKNVDDDE